MHAKINISCSVVRRHHGVFLVFEFDQFSEPTIRFFSRGHGGRRKSIVVIVNPLEALVFDVAEAFTATVTQISLPNTTVRGCPAICCLSYHTRAIIVSGLRPPLYSWFFFLNEANHWLNIEELPSRTAVLQATKA